MSYEMPKAGGNRPLTKPTSETGSVAPSADERDDLRPVALGDLHAADSCAFCGALSSEAELERVLIVSTRAPGMRCKDSITCLRFLRGVA